MPADSFTNNKFHDQLSAIKNDSEQALQHLYKTNYAAVEKYVLQNSGTVDEAKDIYQEAFIAVWRNIQLDKFIPQTENSLNAYLFQISRNKWISQLRSSTHKKTVALTAEEDEAIVVEEIPASDISRLDAVVQNLNKLGNNCREILKRFYYKKESLKTIATGFNWTEATARNNKYRCLEKLRTLLKNQNIQESE